MRILLLLITLTALTLTAGLAWTCTTTAVGKDASTDCSVLVSHSCDGFNDQHIVYIPAMDHEPGSMRPVYYSPSAFGFEPKYGGSPTHRVVTDYFGPVYDTPGIPDSLPLGFIPQVPHTYAYINGRFGIINERQLLIGECTDTARAKPRPEPGKRIMYAADLSRIALERCAKAREAVKLMGDLITRYGYYGPGETLIVADPEEAWVMEMCGYDANGDDGVWVAQRVPDDGFFVAANQFRIREIRRGTKDMMHSSNIFDAAESMGWWKPEDGPLDWTAVYGDGEFHHPYYSLRRVWRAQSMVAPSLNLSAWVNGPNTRAYPFAVKPDDKMSVQDVFAIHRDSYQNTDFDLTRGMAAGPFGDPTRFEGGSEATMSQEDKGAVPGAFERAINIYRCAYAYVSQTRADLPDVIGGVTWLGLDRPATAALMPFYAGALALPESLQQADPLVWNPDSLWMAFNFVANYAQLKYDYMIKDIDAVRKRLETEAFVRQSKLEARALALWKSGKQQAARQMLTDVCNQHAGKTLKAWWNLSHDLYITYNNGYLNTPKSLGQKLFYPAWWLRRTGYENGPTTYKRTSDEH